MREFKDIDRNRILKDTKLANKFCSKNWLKRDKGSIEARRNIERKAELKLKLKSKSILGDQRTLQMIRKPFISQKLLMESFDSTSNPELKVKRQEISLNNHWKAKITNFKKENLRRTDNLFSVKFHRFSFKLKG